MGVKASYPASFIEDVWNQPVPPIEKDLFLVFLHCKKGWFKLFFSEKFSITGPCEDPSENNPMRKPLWRAESTMRDFEVLDPGTPNRYVISKGQGIGVIIVDSHRAYVKLVYDEKEPNGIKVIYTTWHHGTDAKQVLDLDVSLGYDVQYRSGSTKNAKWWCLHEKRAPIGAEGKTFIPGFARYQKYEPVESKSSAAASNPSESAAALNPSESAAAPKPIESESAAATGKLTAKKRDRSKSPKRDTPAKDRSRSASPKSKSKTNDEEA